MGAHPVWVWVPPASGPVVRGRGMRWDPLRRRGIGSHAPCQGDQQERDHHQGPGRTVQDSATSVPWNRAGGAGGGTPIW